MARKPTPIERAIAFAGGVPELARLIDERPGTVWMWKYRGVIPNKKVRKIEAVTGISCHILRPDVFGEAPSHQAA